MNGRVVVVTGASSGLGAQFARALSAAGARLVLGARRSDALDQVAGGLPDCRTVRCDVSVEADRVRLIEEAVETYGRLDGLVNNAGIANLTTALKEKTEDFRRIVEVDLIAPFALARDAATVMRRQGTGGAIVNVTSVAAHRSSSWMACASYVAAKSGLAGLTRELAQQWGRYGIRVNAIAPGPFTTEMTGNEYEEGPVADIVRQRLPLGRAGRAGELDGALLLLMHAAGAYITGQTLVVDGGMIVSG